VCLAQLSNLVNPQVPSGLHGRLSAQRPKALVEAVDGDTIVVQVKGHPEAVRLIGVDTPETKDPRKPVEYFGKEASKFTTSLLNIQLVRLEIQQSPRSRDRYGRLLAYVFRQSDSPLVNQEIVRQGYGHAYRKYPFDPARMQELRAAEREAREHERGLWGRLTLF
jgi:micrococcal nuclease